jgi:hypothetical protein
MFQGPVVIPESGQLDSRFQSFIAEDGIEVLDRIVKRVGGADRLAVLDFS